MTERTIRFEDLFLKTSPLRSKARSRAQTLVREALASPLMQLFFVDGPADGHKKLATHKITTPSQQLTINGWFKLVADWLAVDAIVVVGGPGGTNKLQPVPHGSQFPNPIPTQIGEPLTWPSMQS